MDSISIQEIIIAEFIALIAFFAFPTFEYVSLKNVSRNEGKPELWYLPAHRIRFVARNIPVNRVLSEAKFAAWSRIIIPASPGSNVASLC